jgi:hypothetical protein
MESNEDNFDLEKLTTRVPEKLSKNFLPFTRTDLCALIFMASCTAIAGVLGGKFYTWMGVLGCLLFGVVRFDYGRLYLALGKKLHSRWIRHFKEGLIYDADLAESKPGWLEPEHPFPISIQIIPGRNLAVLHDVEANTDSIVVVGRGSKIPSLPLNEQHEFNQVMAGVPKKAAALVDSPISWAYIYRRRPPNMARHEYLDEQITHPEILARHTNGSNGSQPSDDAAWDFLARNHAAVMDLTRDYAGDVLEAVVCTIEREPALKKAEKSRQLKPEEIRRLGVIRLADAITSELKSCGVMQPRFLATRDASAFLRGAHDASFDRRYYDWLLHATVEDIEASNLHRPRKVYARDGYLVTGDDESNLSYHAVLRVKTNPELSLPHSYRQLHHIDVPWLTVTAAAKVYRGNWEIRGVLRQRAITKAVMDYMGKDVDTLKDQKKMDYLRHREAELFWNRYGADYLLLVAVHASDEDELQESLETALAAIRENDMTAEHVQEEAWQSSAVRTATTGVIKW